MGYSARLSCECLQVCDLRESVTRRLGEMSSGKRVWEGQLGRKKDGRGGKREGQDEKQRECTTDNGGGTSVFAEP